MKLRLISDGRLTEQPQGQAQDDAVSPWGDGSPLVQHMARKAAHQMAAFIKSRGGSGGEDAAAKSWPSHIGKLVFGNELSSLIKYGVIENNLDGSWHFNISALRPPQTESRRS